MLICAKREDLELHVATMLGYNPSKPDTWPKDVIDQILRGADYYARQFIDEQVRRLMSK